MDSTKIEMNFEQAVTLVTNKIDGWLEQLVSMLPNIAVALLVMLLFGMIGYLVKLGIQRLARKSPEKKALIFLLSNIIFCAVLIIGLFVALSVLNLSKAVTSLLAGAGVIGLALGFALKDTTANFLSGMFIASRQPYKLGDIIQSQNYMGTVEDINLRSTILSTFQGHRVIIPNKMLFEDIIVNYSTGERRIDLEIGVSYVDDLEKAEKIAIEAIEKLGIVKKDKGVQLYYNEFGSSSINFTLQIWIDYPDEPGFLEARSKAIKTIKSTFEEHDITIPFPIRTLDFGIKGGEDLQQMLNGELAEAS